MATEGQVAIGPNGERAVFRGGQWVVVPSQPQMPTDPSFQYEGPKAAADLQNTQDTIADRARDNERADTTLAADLFNRGLRLTPGGEIERIPGWTPPPTAADAADQKGKLSRLNQLARQIDRVQELYDAGVGKTKGVKGVQDYLPSDVNAAFDAAGAALSQMGLAAFRVPGTGNVSDRDAIMFDRANLPTATTRDAAIEEQLRGLRARVEEELKVMGQPVPQWRGAESQGQQQDDRPNALTMPRIVNEGGPGAAGFGATTGGTPIDPNYQAEYEGWVQQNAGRFTPEQYAAFRSGLDQKYGYAPTADYIAEGQRIADTLQRGGSLNLTIPPIERELSGTEQFRNNLISNPLGAAAAGFTDMAGFGGVSALAGDQMAALSDQNPLAMAAGQIAGSITGAGAVAKAAKEAAKRLAPRTLQGGKAAQFARNVATDAAYSGIYGGVTEGDPTTAAALGTGGSIAGQALGRGVGRVIGGVDVSPAVQTLKARGISMTVPQQLGGFAKSVEDKAISVPLVGDMIRARRMGGIADFNRQAFDEAGQPIGARVRDLGMEGVEQLGDQVADAYDQATSGVTVPLDQPFYTDIANAGLAARQLPEDYGKMFAQTMRNRVQPILGRGQISGDDYQQVTRALKNKRATADRATPGFEDEYRDALSQTMDALTGPFMRQGGDSVVSGLSSANAANRNFRTIEDAATRAAGGSESGTPFVFTPSQLQRAGLKTEAKYPGARPFAELADAGQEVLPSRVPNSGTADRMMQMAMPAGLLGSGAGLGFAAGGDMQGAQTGAGLSALATVALLLGGTKAGQKALQKAVIDRPARAQMIGRAIRNKAGMFGSGTLPLLISDY